jgi:hypothetical protein
VPIRTIDRALDCVREAFYVARAERKPVVLSVPLDLQTEEFPYLPDYTPSMDLLPRAQVLRPDPAVVDEVVAMVAEAERPVVIGGRGATWSGAKGALESLAQESGALLATTLLGKGLFEGNPFALDIAGTFATDLGRELFAESDLVIAAGAGLGHYTTEGGYLFPNAKVVRIDTQPRGLWQGLRTADLHVQADARAAAEAIVGRLREKGISRRGWRSNEIAEKIATTAENPDPKPYTPTPGTLDPRPVVKELDAAVPKDWDIISPSSLREVLFVALFATYQKDLEKEVPDVINKMFGMDVSQHSAIASILFIVLLYYGAEFVRGLVNKAIGRSLLQDELNGIVAEVSKEFHIGEDRIKQVLADCYRTPSRIKLLGKAAIRVFAPSKRQNNAAIIVGDRRIEPRIVAEVPSDTRLLDADEPPATEPLENVRIELHAQDLDRAKSGWAAVIPEISQTRLRMQIYPPIKTEDIYTKHDVLGDIILVSRRNEAGNMEPYMFYLVRVDDAA